MKYPHSLFAAFLLLSFPGGVPAGVEETAPAVSIERSVSRDYGYFIGDLVKVSYRISLPPDLRLDEKSLPRAGEKSGEWLDIRGVISEEKVERGTRAYAVNFTYQVFTAGERAERYTIPPIPFSYGPGGNPSAYSSSLPAVPVVISPLTGAEDQALPAVVRFWTSRTAQWVRGAGVVLLLGGVAPLVFPTRRRIHIHSPFGAAAKKISRGHDPAAALILFRTAISEKAGKPIFPHNLDEFFRVFPRALTYEREVREMVMLSEEVVFNPRNTVAKEGLANRAAAVLKDLRKAERWA